MQYLGDYRIDDYISFGAQLHRFSSGAVYAPTGNATYTFYENNSTSGAPTGGNLGQLNSKTGLYTARVQLTAAAGFEVGKEYLIHIEATVDSVAAAELLMFRIIANPKVDVDTIKTQTVTCAAGVTMLASVGTAATSTAQTGDAYARLGAPAGASVSADVAAAKADTAAILADTGTDGVKIHPTQGPVTFSGQVKITASSVGEGALHIVNSGLVGIGLYAEGPIAGSQNKSTAISGVGQLNQATGSGGYGQANQAIVSSGVGQYNRGNSVDWYGVPHVDTLNAIADAILKRDWTAVTGEASRSLLNALRFLRNKWSISGATLTVMKEDDATTAWTAALSTDAAADPVTGSDPA